MEDAGFKNSALSSIIVREAQYDNQVVSLYDAVNYGGTAKAFEVGDHSCEAFKERGINDKMRCIKIPAGFYVELYNGCFTGGGSRFTGPF